MKIGIIGSGGDGSGMNNCLYEIVKSLADNEIVLFNRGFCGVIDDDVANFSLEDLKHAKDAGGVIIKTSRCAEFKTEKGMRKAIKNLKKHDIELLIILGGNGSYYGAKDLIERNIKVLFIPTTIDNDIVGTDYSIGFDTAVSKACEFIDTVQTSMYSLNRICIYEVMGRDCPALANAVAEKMMACYCYTSKSNMSDCLKAIKKAIKTNTAPFVVLQENTENIETLRSYLDKNLKQDVKSCVVGYFQRGGKPTKLELKMGKGFALEVAKTIKRGEYNKMISYERTTDKFISKVII